MPSVRKLSPHKFAKTKTNGELNDTQNVIPNASIQPTVDESDETTFSKLNLMKWIERESNEKINQQQQRMK